MWSWDACGDEKKTIHGKDKVIQKFCSSVGGIVQKIFHFGMTPPCDKLFMDWHLNDSELVLG